jgi:pyrimidine operon attenuation protein/uracil phosphoribosyltransferase
LMKPVSILNKQQFALTIKRLCFQLIENHEDFSDTVLIGLQPRGIYLADRIKAELTKILKTDNIHCGHLDITFHRDDFRRKEKPMLANPTIIDFEIEDRKVVLVDDVLFTGRTIRAGLDAMLAFGRPREVELLVLIDRRFKREIPVQADYVGKWVDSIESQRVEVEWKEAEGEDKVILHSNEKK